MKYAEQYCLASALNIKQQLLLAQIIQHHFKHRFRKECVLYKCLTNGWTLALSFAQLLFLPQGEFTFPTLGIHSLKLNNITEESINIIYNIEV